MTGTPPLRATRRRLLRAPAAAVAAGLVVTGCDVSGARGPGDGATSPRSPGPLQPTTVPAADPDDALVTRVRGDVAQSAALVVAAGRRRRALRRELAPWRRLHAQHLEALPGDDTAVVGSPATGDVASLRRRVLQRESELQTALADAAVEAESGPLAALLASMSAAVAQRLAAGEDLA